MTAVATAEAMVLETAQVGTPVGGLVVIVRQRAVCGLVFADHLESVLTGLGRRFGALTLRAGDGARVAAQQLADYIDGNCQALDAVDVDTGGTPFQQRVWQTLRTVPPGNTVSYAELARAAGSPRAVRAVGTANAQNPVSIVIPCHRVIRSDGKLGGYGGGCERKQWLLEHESAWGGTTAPLFR